MGKTMEERVYDEMGSLNKKMDRMIDSHAKNSERLTSIETTLRITPIPSQPCEFLKAHEQEHKDNMTLLKRPVVSGIVGAIFVMFGMFLRPLFEWIKDKL